ncbi:hypothetical protein OIDMADRAFT_147340 [Oidiodendron maius Zn]|uniref:2EXR domain-containing protein n=1 Tax=Oidiodendron maius (strain Zn) TaxID=913774 RepID=A0A0C3GP24_OIDMZ|nr:hypothetical protein OIDMADRAFT_147340 [Oidiodendron maius Zn]
MAMHYPHHQQPFTPHQVQTDRPNFHCFPLLPKELRLKIWEFALSRSRIIHLRLKDLQDPRAGPAPTTDAAEMSRMTTNNERFWISADGHQTLSKMFCVSREAREEALSFYRVRFPCWFRSVAGVMKPRMLYFNPEHDFLRISPEWSVKNTLFNFLHLLKTTYDPRHIGLRNLVVSNYFLAGNDWELIDPSDPDLDRGTIESFKGLLKNLNEVFFFSTTLAGRQILGIHSSIWTDEIVYNCSFPIQVNVSTFDRLPRDPRRIGEDLKRVFIGTHDHRHTIRLWYRRLNKFSISAPTIKYKWYIAFDPQNIARVSDIETARKFMQLEDSIWNGIDHPDLRSLELPGYKFPVGAQSERYKKEDLETAVKPAFGFWLFPIDVLGPLEEEGGPATPLWDFSKNWPELGVVSLPERRRTGNALDAVGG